MIGSSEWVEEFEKKIAANAIIYINCDLAFIGNYSYEAKASPLVHNILYSITKDIDFDNTTIFNRWLDNKPNIDKTLPKINSLMGSNSDHTLMLQRAGIPCIDHRFVNNYVKLFKYFYL